MSEVLIFALDVDIEAALPAGTQDPPQGNFLESMRQQCMAIAEAKVWAILWYVSSALACFLHCSAAVAPDQSMP